MSKIEIPAGHRYSKWADLLPAHTGHWFDKDTMRFWGSRINWATLTPIGTKTEDKSPEWLFISSEHNFDRTKRLYSIRVITEDGDINTLGDFQNFESLTEAKRELNEQSFLLGSC